MADANRTTLAVAVAGITATALVGIAATAATWLSARDDRETQRALARDERTYDRRVAVYLDAIDVIEDQEGAFYDYGTERSGYEANLPPPIHYEGSSENVGLPLLLRRVPGQRLTTRLRVFGTSRAFEAFQKAQSLQEKIPARSSFKMAPIKVDMSWVAAYKAFHDQIGRFEDIVHEELGAG
jgi:hypothetical protein